MSRTPLILSEGACFRLSTRSPPHLSTFNTQFPLHLTMATQKMIPRFLLPQTSWTKSIARQPGRNSLRVDLPNHHRPFSITSSTSPRAAIPLPLTSSTYNQNIHHRSTISQAPPLAQSFSTSAPNHRDHHFDTLKFVQRLRDEGFSEEQSKAMMLVLSDVIEESIQNLTRTMVLKEGNHYCNPAPPPSYQPPTQLHPHPALPNPSPNTNRLIPHFHRRRPLDLHPKSRLHKTPLRAPRPRLLRLLPNASLA